MKSRRSIPWQVWTIMVLSLVVIACIFVSFMTGIDQREFNKNATKVERYCGHRAAERFRAVYSPNDDSEGPMQSWVEHCTLRGNK